MHTVTIELLRTGESINHALSKETKYIALCGTQPPIDLTIPCDQETFNKNKQYLRYGETDEKSRREGISFFSKLIVDVLDKIDALRVEGQTADTLHLRMVMNPKELAQLPFELTSTPNGLQGMHSVPFLKNPQRLTTLTREVRQVGSSKYLWPSKPHILFAWAEPEDAVPHADHLSMLASIVKDFTFPMKDNIDPVPDIGIYITELQGASLESINNAIKKAISKDNPFTHIHLLVHGKKDDNDGGEEYKLVLCSNNDQHQPSYSDGKELADALTETENGKTYIPAVISLMACDSSNTGSISQPAGSIAHQLHESGIPCVFASQFPLTIKGSIQLVKTLYGKILSEGNDPREALYATRKAFFDNHTHDWASLVAYIRFPEDIDEQLKDNRLKIMLQLNKAANAWTDHILLHKDEMDQEKVKSYYKEIDERLDNSISGLKKLFESGTKEEKRRMAEHCGLLGSVYKRKAEHLFRKSLEDNGKRNTLIKQSWTALKSSRQCYLRGYREDKNHWTAIQYLSLQAIITGSLTSSESKDIWIVAKVFADDDTDKSKDSLTKVWALGSLAELYFLAPLTIPENHPDYKNEKESARREAKKYIELLADATSDYATEPSTVLEDIVFAQESTQRQFERYVNWWPEMIQSSAISLLKQLATELLSGFKLWLSILYTSLTIIDGFA